MGGPSVGIFFAVLAIESSYFASRLNRQHNVSSFLTMFGFDRLFCCWPIKSEYPRRFGFIWTAVSQSTNWKNGKDQANSKEVDWWVHSSEAVGHKGGSEGGSLVRRSQEAPPIQARHGGSSGDTKVPEVH